MNMLQENNWLLSVGTFLPMLGVVVMMLIPKASDQSVKLVALATSVATLAVGIFTALKFDFGQAEKMQFVADVEWISVIKSSYLIGVDGISFPLYLLSMVITLLVVIYSLDHVPSPGKPKAFFSLLLVLQTGMAGTFIAQDLILFFVFFELVLLPMFFLIGVWGGEQRQYASIKFFLYTMFGSALMLVAFLALFFKTGAESFSIPYLVENGGSIAKNIQIWIFAGMFVGFAVKVPMFPFHTWLPDAHTQAPTQGSVILAAILLKLGTYGFVRIALPILPDAAREWATVHRRLGRDRHHLWCAWLSCTNRHEALDCVFFSCAHGLCDARHFNADKFRYQRRDVRNGRSRFDNRNVVLHRGKRQRAIPHT